MRHDDWIDLVTEEQDEKDRRVRELERQLQAERRKVRGAYSDLHRAEERLRIALAIRGDDPPAAVLPKRTNQARLESAAVFVLSDLHIEDKVDKAKVNGANEYNLEIAAKRWEDMIRCQIWYLEKGIGNGVDVTSIVLAFLGDGINGYIHEEMVENNLLAPLEALRELRSMYVRMIDTLLERTKLPIACVGVVGNHGRLTKRPTYSTATEQNLEYFVYRDLDERYSSAKRVTWHIPEGKQLYLDILGHPVRFTHGDDIKSGGGVHGLQVPLLRAHDKWNKQRHAELTVIGHFHQYQSTMWGVTNGAMKGFDPFALSHGFSSEPPIQAAFLVDKEHGKVFDKGFVLRP